MANKLPPRVDQTRQLFVEDSALDHLRGVRRKLNPLTKDPDHPVLHCDRPWEGTDIRAFGSVWREPGDGQLRMWYVARPRDPDDQRHYTTVCLATSTDGLHWEKPDLHLYDYWGNSANNICICPYYKSDNATARFDTQSILLDPQDPNPRRRYKRMAWQMPVPDKWGVGQRYPSGYYVSFSPDGLHWSQRPRPVFRLVDGIGDCMTLMHDHHRGRYTAFVKILSSKYGAFRRCRLSEDGERYVCEDSSNKWVHATKAKPIRRMRGISYSNDFVNWTEPRSILPEDRDDPPDVQFYNNSGFTYGHMYLGFLYVYHRDTTGSIDAQLIWSRDGEVWHRAFDRTPVVPNGLDERDWDMGCHSMFTNPPIVMGDELWFYYGSCWNRHPGGNLRVHRGTYSKGGTGFGRAKLRLDGFVSLDAGPRTGKATTRPVRLAHGALAINGDAHAGEIRAQVLRRGRPLAGFDFRSCQPLRLDRTRHLLNFKGGKLPQTGGPVRIEFALKNAKLYAFWTEPMMIPNV